LAVPGTIGNAAEFVGQAVSLRPILIGLPTSVPMPPRRVDNPPQVANLPHIKHYAGFAFSRPNSTTSSIDFT
jgi:hypothetical protein